MGSWLGSSAGLGSLGAEGTLLLLTGIGWGSICLGKPLKNQAPERFHTWGDKTGGGHVGLKTCSPISPPHSPFFLFNQLFGFLCPGMGLAMTTPSMLRLFARKKNKKKFFYP